MKKFLLIASCLREQEKICKESTNYNQETKCENIPSKVARREGKTIENLLAS